MQFLREECPKELMDALERERLLSRHGVVPCIWITGLESYSGAAGKPAQPLATRQTSDQPPGIADRFTSYRPPLLPNVIKAE